MLTENYVTTTEAAEIMGKGSNLVAKLCQAGRLPGAEKLANTWLIPRDSVLNYQPSKRGAKTKKQRLAEERERFLGEAQS